VQLPKYRRYKGPFYTLVAAAFLTLPILAQSRPPLTLDDAIRSTLLRHPQLRIQEQQVIAQQGVLQQASGQFDTNLVGDASQGHAYRPLTAYEEFLYAQYHLLPIASASTNTSQIAIGATKELRNGIVLTPSITATRLTDNLTNRGGISQGTIGFAVTLPLLRGRGRAVVTAQETSSALQLKAAMLEVNETITELLATVASSYWNVVAATKQLNVLRESESRASRLAESIQSLIDADRLPRTDINNAEADMASREANRLAAEQRLVEARQQLSIDMGLDASEVSELPDTATDFPGELTPDQLPNGPVALERYVQLALEQRPELVAQKQRQQASQIFVGAARNSLKPDLDVTLGTGASGLDEGSRIDEYLFSPLHSARGVDFRGSITYRFPPARDAAAGALKQATAAAAQADLEYQEIARRTAASVGPALSGVRSEAIQLGRTHESVLFYRNSLDAENEKLRMGAGNVINTITIADRLTGALLSEIQAELEYAQALVRLRLATSTIVSPGQWGGSVDPAVFSMPPPLPETTETGIPK
jgi:outer membrane protein TolC